MTNTGLAGLREVIGEPLHHKEDNVLPGERVSRLQHLHKDNINMPEVNACSTKVAMHTP